MNETIRRFGYPETLVAEYDHWVVLLRPAQPTLGSLVLAAKSEATAFSDLQPDAVCGLHATIGDMERTLKDKVDYAKINYLMLMMVDPHVHFHVIPRYQGERSACGLTIADAGWPKMPALGEAVTLDAGQVAEMTGWLRGRWPSAR